MQLHPTVHFFGFIKYRRIFSVSESVGLVKYAPSPASFNKAFEVVLKSLIVLKVAIKETCLETLWI